MSDSVIEELMGNDVDGMSNRKLADILEILKREEELQAIIQDSGDVPAAERRTRGVPSTSSYLGLLPKKAREAWEKDIQAAAAINHWEPNI